MACFIASEGGQLFWPISLATLPHWQQYNVIIYYLHLAVQRESQWALVDTGY